MTDTTMAIRNLNDRFRKGDRAVPGSWMITAGVQALIGDDANKVLLISLVANFSAFDGDNDPHHEHDFGAFDFAGQRLFWKIDLYEEPIVNKPNEAPNVTRVLTIMLASEY